MLAYTLSDRETEILALVANGLSNQEIARALHLAPETVKWYNKRIFAELGVQNRTHAAARARELGLLGQEGAEASAAPATIATPATPAAAGTTISHSPHNLPAEVTTFVGRQSEMAAAAHLLEQARLVTFIGPGGSGKTRLALQVAAKLLLNFKDGVYFVPLAPVSRVEQIVWAIAEYLDVAFDGRSQPAQQLRDYFRPKHLLLVLDNFEHLVEGAGLLAELLSAAPGLKILVTSRERLGLYGEVTLTVDGLALPDASRPDVAGRSDAVQLFVQRAHATSSNLNRQLRDYDSIARICRLVEGMPLAIELAATWVDVLGLREIADELAGNLDLLEVESEPGRDSRRSIRAAFERSWNLLDETQQTAFRRLSAFRGGFTREAAEGVAGVGLRTLQALANKSLLFRNPHTGRYGIHELLRHYAEKQLGLSGEAPTLQLAHAAYFAGFMAQRWPWMKDRRQKAALDEIEAEIDNTRTAWQAWLQAGDVGQLQKMLHGLWAIYDVRGWHAAGIELLEEGVQVMRAAPGAEAEACLGWLLAVQGLWSVPVRDYDDQGNGPSRSWMAGAGLYSISGAGPRQGLKLARRGVDILRRLGRRDEMLVVPLLCLAATASQVMEEEAVSLEAAQACLDLAGELGDPWAAARARQFLALRAIEEGDYPRAEERAFAALTTFEANGDKWSTSVLCVDVLGLLAIRRRQFDTARAWMRRGLAAAEEIGFRYSIQTAYWQLGFVAALEDNYGEAAVHWLKAMSVGERMLSARGLIGFGRI